MRRSGGSGGGGGSGSGGRCWLKTRRNTDEIQSLSLADWLQI